MATHTASRQSDSRLLRRTLQGNGIFSGISGIVCIVGASPIASFIGLGRPLILVVTGAIVLLYAVSLFMTAARQFITAQAGLLYAILDSVWVIGSIILLFGNWISFTIGGKWAIVLVAVVMAIFAELQYYGAWRARQ